MMLHILARFTKLVRAVGISTEQNLIRHEVSRPPRFSSKAPICTRTMTLNTHAPGYTQHSRSWSYKQRRNRDVQRISSPYISNSALGGEAQRTFIANASDKITKYTGGIARRR